MQCAHMHVSCRCVECMEKLLESMQPLLLSHPVAGRVLHFHNDSAAAIGAALDGRHG